MSASSQPVRGAGPRGLGAGPATGRYTAPAVILHWLVAAFVLVTLPLGIYMADLPVSPAKLKYYSWHKWIGVTIFLLVVLRAAWRIGHPPPAPLPGQPRWQVQTAHYTHLALYALLFLTPLAGWLLTSAAGYPIVYLGLVQIPDLVPKDKQLKEIFEVVHAGLALSMGALVLLHIGAALKHALIDRDGTLSRMRLGGR